MRTRVDGGGGKRKKGNGRVEFEVARIQQRNDKSPLAGYVPAKFLMRNGGYVRDPAPGGSQSAPLFSDAMASQVGCRLWQELTPGGPPPPAWPPQVDGPIRYLSRRTYN